MEGGEYLSCKWAKSSSYRGGNNSHWNSWKGETVVFVIVSFKQKEVDFMWRATELHNFLPESTAKSSWVSSGHNSLGFTHRNLRTGKSQDWLKETKHSPFYPVSCLSSHMDYRLLPYPPPLNPRLGVRAAGTKLLRLWRWSPGTEQMQPEDKVLEGRGQAGVGGGGHPFHLPRGHTAAPALTGPPEWEQTAVQFFPEPKN